LTTLTLTDLVVSCLPTSVLTQGGMTGPGIGAVRPFQPSLKASPISASRQIRMIGVAAMRR
jgi:hypothetical protein